MKSKISTIISVFVLFLFSSVIHAQHKKGNLESMYVTMITLHGAEDANFDEWLKVEKEYFDKVTSKIDLIVEHEVLIRYYSNDLSEIKVVNVIKNWNDIEEINYIREALIEKAWPNREDR